MPRGWLKHRERVVGKKSSRGGSSYRRPEGKRALKPRRNDRHRFQNINIDGTEEELSWERNEDTRTNIDREDFSSGHKRASSSPFCRNEDAAAKECRICCEIRPLVSLSKKCDHPPVCRGCLREIYVNQAQQDVSNYPLRCYDPSCRKQVHDVQLVKHNLIRKDKELARHYRLKVFGKAYSSSSDIVHCPECDFPKMVTKQETVKCMQCKITYEVWHDGRTNRGSTIAAIEAIKGDNKGSNSGWAHCPKCKMIVSKGDGCDHMICVCGKHFSWTEALDRKNRYKLKANKMKHAVTSSLPEINNMHKKQL